GSGRPRGHAARRGRGASDAVRRARLRPSLARAQREPHRLCRLARRPARRDRARRADRSLRRDEGRGARDGRAREHVPPRARRDPARGVRGARPQGTVRPGARGGDPRIHRDLLAVRGADRRRRRGRHLGARRRGRGRRGALRPAGQGGPSRRRCVPCYRTHGPGAPSGRGARMTRGTSARRAARLVALLAVALGLVGCGDSWQGSATALRIGYMPNLTHAPAIVGVEGGFFEAALPAGVRLSTMTFNAGPNVIEALNAGSIDAAFVGANPTINGFVRSQGRALRVVAGTASGGAALVVRSGIETPEDLRGGRLATPQLGNTQDVAARHWLAEQGLETTRTGGGDVQILPQSNATALQSFRAGDVDG